jgi:hypothetical protein|tara:strand:- start:187 stop:366 length:180 start_codon:yes stop_codon:yes gene_type:complete
MDRQRNLIRGSEKEEDQPLRGGASRRPQQSQTKTRNKTSLTPAERRARGDAMRANRMKK